MSITTSSPTAFLNQLAWRVAAGIAAAAALVAVIVASNQPPAVKQLPAFVERDKSSSPASRELSLGGNIARCVEFCASHVTTERSFVVFSNGTCVIVDEPTSQPVVDAIHTLEDCSGPNARFITRQVENGNFLVTYRRAAFHCVFSQEISRQRGLVEREFLGFLTKAEQRSMPSEFNPPFHAKLGLVGRARLNQDARDLKVARVVRAKPSSPTAPQPLLEEGPLPALPPAHVSLPRPDAPEHASLPTTSIPDGWLLPPKATPVLASARPGNNPSHQEAPRALTLPRAKDPETESPPATLTPPAPRAVVNVFERFTEEDTDSEIE